MKVEFDMILHYCFDPVVCIYVYVFVCICISMLFLLTLGGTGFQEAVKLKPTFADAYLNLGNVYKVSYRRR